MSECLNVDYVLTQTWPKTFQNLDLILIQTCPTVDLVLTQNLNTFGIGLHSNLSKYKLSLVPKLDHIWPQSRLVLESSSAFESSQTRLCKSLCIEYMLFCLWISCPVSRLLTLQTGTAVLRRLPDWEPLVYWFRRVVTRKSWTSCPGWISATLSQNTFSPCSCLLSTQQTHIRIHHFHSASRHTGAQEELPAFSILHDVIVEREEVTEKEEIIYNKVSRPEKQKKKKKKPFLVIRWADQGDCLIGRDWRELGVRSLK